MKKLDKEDLSKIQYVNGVNVLKWGSTKYLDSKDKDEWRVLSTETGILHVACTEF